MTAIPHSETGSLSQAHSGPVYSAYRILQVAFVVAPIIAGIDKFTDRLVNWDMYLAPVVSRIIGGHDHVFMMVAGVIEIVAGILVALKPRFLPPPPRGRARAAASPPTSLGAAPAHSDSARRPPR